MGISAQRIFQYPFIFWVHGFFYFLALFIFLIVLLIIAKARRISLRRLPLKYKRVNDPQKLKYRREFHRDLFHPTKIPQDIDYIVIGSGIGGLSSAAILGRLGYKVLVLEQHDRAGGCMHSFVENGYEFDTGIHYIGNVKKISKWLGSIVHPFFRLRWVYQGTEDDGRTYDRAFFGDHASFSYRQKALAHDLRKQFPEEQDAIDKWEAASKQQPTVGKLWGAAKLFPLFVGRILMQLVAWFYPVFTMTYKDFVEQITDNVALQNCFMGNLGDAGGYPEDNCVFNILGIMNHFDVDGGFYPIGGPERITKGLIPVIERPGGRVLVKATVDEILVSGDRCLGVRVQRVNGQHESIPCSKGVISAIGYSRTNLLTNMKLVKPAFSANPSVSHLSIFLGFEGDPKELDLPSSNCWCYAGMKEKENYSDFLHRVHDQPQGDVTDGLAMAFIGFPSAKDPSFPERFPGKTTAVVVTELKWDVVEEWKDEKLDNRSEEYQELKKKYAYHILDTIFYKHFPQLKGKLDYIKIGSPLSSAHYLGKDHGESYGIQFDLTRFLEGYKQLRPETPIDGLWLTGQDIVTAGWAGALAAGELTVATILGYYDIPALLSGRTLQKDLAKLGPVAPKYFATEYMKPEEATSKND